MTRNFCLWQEISYCGKKFLSVARHFFLRKMSVCDNTFAPENLFFLQESICLTGTFCLILQKTLSCQICDKNTWISANISCELEDFVGAWLPGSRGISHPAHDYDCFTCCSLPSIPMVKVSIHRRVCAAQRVQTEQPRAGGCGRTGRARSRTNSLNNLMFHIFSHWF